MNILFREEILPKLIQRKFPILLDNASPLSLEVPEHKYSEFSPQPLSTIKHLPIFPLGAIPGCRAPFEFIPER